MKIFRHFKNFSCGEQFFVPDDESAYEAGNACGGFGSVRYGEGSVYCGRLWFDGKHYNKLGFGRQDFMLSNIGNLNPKHNLRRAFYIGSFDYRKTDWIYGNGVMYYVDGDNKPAFYMKGFFEGVNRVADYEGEFDDSLLAAGYTPQMEGVIDDWGDAFEFGMKNYENLISFENLFIGDSYFELWGDRAYAGTLFYEQFDKTRNLNLGVGGTRFLDWMRFLPRVGALSAPKRIFINLGFNDLHGNRSAAQVFEDFQRVLASFKARFPHARYFLLNVVKAPLYGAYHAEEEKLNELTKGTQERLGVTVLDLRSEIELASQAENVFAQDEVHLNARGYETLAAEVKKAIENEGRPFYGEEL